MVGTFILWAMHRAVAVPDLPVATGIPSTPDSERKKTDAKSAKSARLATLDATPTEFATSTTPTSSFASTAYATLSAAHWSCILTRTRAPMAVPVLVSPVPQSSGPTPMPGPQTKPILPVPGFIYIPVSQRS